mmetsp:Transcript_119535/g.217221  ORF Transcript_119535/g.217221 Transcript_119535/m.217221 type:complete len:163 (-) Transcript_119535:87-575(-)
MSSVGAVCHAMDFHTSFAICAAASMCAGTFLGWSLSKIPVSLLPKEMTNCSGHEFKKVEKQQLESAWTDFYRRFLLPAAKAGMCKVSVGPDSDLKFGHAFHGISAVDVKRIAREHNVQLKVHWLSLPTFWMHELHEVFENWTTEHSKQITDWTQEVNCTFSW